MLYTHTHTHTHETFKVLLKNVPLSSGKKNLQVLLKKVPLSSKPVFDFRRLFSLLSVATAVAGSGNLLRGIVGLLGTAGLSFFSLFNFLCVNF